MKKQNPTNTDRPTIRKTIDKILPNASELDAFIQSYWPQTYRRFSRGMDRLEKVTLLLDADERLAEIAKALDEVITRQKDSKLPSNETRSVDAKRNIPPRPRKGKRDQQIIIEMDLRELDRPMQKKLIAFLSQIQGYRVILRHYRSGSVVLTIRGTWQGTARLMEEYVAGRLTKILSYDIISISWIDHKSVLETIMDRISVCALLDDIIKRIFRRYSNLINTISTSLSVPRWVSISIVIFFMVSLSFAAQRVAKLVMATIQAKANRSRSTTTMPKTQQNLIHVEPLIQVTPLSEPSDLGLANNTKKTHSSEGSNGRNQPEKREEKIDKQELKSIKVFSLNVKEYEYSAATLRCSELERKFDAPTSMPAWVDWNGADKYCRCIGGRLPHETELRWLKLNKTADEIMYDWTSSPNVQIDGDGTLKRGTFRCITEGNQR